MYSFVKVLLCFWSKCIVSLRFYCFWDHRQSFLAIPYWKQWGICSWELRILPASFSLQFFLKTNKEIAPESSGSSLLHFPYNSLLKTIRKLLPRAQDPPGPFSLWNPYLNQWKGGPRGRHPPTCTGQKKHKRFFTKSIKKQEN